MKANSKSLILFFLLFFTQLSYAQQDPMILMQRIADQMTSAFQAQKAAVKRNPKVAYRIVYRYLVPHVDTIGMSKSVLGRNGWRAATQSQRLRFTKEFTRLVVSGYSVALQEYNDDVIKFFPIRGGYRGKNRLTVQSRIVRKGKPSIKVDYRLFLYGNKWYMIDIRIQGVSLLNSYRSQFALFRII